LTQYPELADELDEEMKRLEEENAEKRAEIEKLENQIGSNNVGKTVDSGDSSSNNNGDKAVDGTSNMAFTRGKNVNNNDSNEEPTSDIVMSGEVPINELIDDDYPSTIIDDADVQDSTSSTTSYNNPDTRDDRIEEDTNMNTYMATHDDDDDDDDDNNDTVGTGMESLPDETLSATATDSVDCKEDFAISHLAVEILHVWVNRTKDSVKRQVQQVKLILQPLLHTGDVAWRQIKSSFEKVQKRYKDAKNQSSSSPNKQMEELAEPTICDDPLSNSA